MSSNRGISGSGQGADRNERTDRGNQGKDFEFQQDQGSLDARSDSISQQSNLYNPTSRQEQGQFSTDSRTSASKAGDQGFGQGSQQGYNLRGDQQQQGQRGEPRGEQREQREQRGEREQRGDQIGDQQRR